MTHAECMRYETLAPPNNPHLVEAPRYVGSVLLSGYTAAQRAHTPLPDAQMQNPDRLEPNQEALDDYYDQLEDMGIVLLKSSRQHQ